MELAGQLTLPEEILHAIGKYLKAKDVLNCSKTCCYLRCVLNHDSIWKKIVPKKYLQLKAEEQILKPAFQWNPELVELEDRLTPFCEHRVHYLWVIHLVNNWNSSTMRIFATQMLNPSVRQRTCVFQPDQKGGSQVFYQNRYIFSSKFINDFESDGIQVWDVHQKPVIHSFLSVTNPNYNQFYIIGSNVVVVECKKVCVYQINLPEITFPHIYSFIVTSMEVMENGVDEHGEVCDEYCEDWQHFNIDQYLVSYSEVDEYVRSYIHVWDIVNAKKLPLIVLPEDKLFVSVESHQKDEWLFRLKHFKPVYNTYFFSLFNIKTNTFSEASFMVDCIGTSNLYSSKLYTATNEPANSKEGTCAALKCSVYSFKTSEKVNERLFTYKGTERRCDVSPITSVVNGAFILLIDDLFMTIDAVTLETIDVFSCGLDVANIVSQLNILDSIFIVTCHMGGFFEIWSIAKKQKLRMPLSIIKDDFLCRWYFNDLMTKMVMISFNEINQKEVTVLHFW